MTKPTVDDIAEWLGLVKRGKLWHDPMRGEYLSDGVYNNTRPASSKEIMSFYKDYEKDFPGNFQKELNQVRKRKEQNEQWRSTRGW